MLSCSFSARDWSVDRGKRLSSSIKSSRPMGRWAKEESRWVGGSSVGMFFCVMVAVVLAACSHQNGGLCKCLPGNCGYGNTSLQRSATIRHWLCENVHMYWCPEVETTWKEVFYIYIYKIMYIYPIYIYTLYNRTPTIRSPFEIRSVLISPRAVCRGPLTGSRIARINHWKMY